MRPDEPLSRIMTETVVVIEADRPVSEALDCFFQYPIHHLPIVRNGRLAGMLSSADVLKLEFFVPKNAVDRAGYLDERFKIDQLMRQPVASLKVHNSLAEAAEKLTGGVHALPIVDDAEHVIGIVTTTDIIRSMLFGPPRKGQLPLPGRAAAAEKGDEGVTYHLRPTDEEYAVALRTAETLHVESRDPRYLGKSMLYLDQRRQFLERVAELADRFLRTGQNEQVHALLLKAIHAAKRAEEHAQGLARVPFPLE